MKLYALTRLTLICFCLAFCASSQAQEFTPWQDAPAAERVLLDAANSRVAFLGDKRLTVHRLDKTGALGEKLLQTAPEDEITAATWWGNGLLVSRIKNGQGETVRIIPGEKVPEKAVLTVAGYWVLPSPAGDTIAIAPLAASGEKFAKIDFYSNKGGLWQKSGNYTRKDVGGLSPFTFAESSLYLIDWARDGSGVFAVIPYELSRSRDRMLSLVASDGAAYDLVPPNSPIIPEQRYALPLISPLPAAAWPALGVSSAVVTSLGIPNSSEPRSNELLPTDWKRAPMIAWMPDGQAQIFQRYSQWDGKSTSPLCVVNSKQKVRQVLAGEFPIVSAAFGWVGDRLLVRTVGESRKDSQLGLLRITPAPQAFEKAEPPAETGRETPKEVQEFLQRPEIAPPPDAWIRTESPEENGQREYRTSRFGFDSVTVEVATGRVVRYRGPNPVAPLPAAPMAVEAAQVNAEKFARSFNPAWMAAGEYTVKAGELNDQMHYPFRFVRGPQDWIEVQVRGGDGKIGGYREFASLKPYELENLKWGRDTASKASPTVAISRPVFSPDGSFIAFSSPRPMPGYPAWWANRPAGLWVVSSKGGTPKMIAPEAPWRVTWSPDSRRLVFNDSHSKTHVVDVVTGKTVSSPVSPFEEYPTVVGWRTAGELLLLWKDNLMGWSPDKPDALPRIVARKWYFGNHGFRGSALSPDGATMAITYEGGFREGSSLWTLPVANLSAKPVAVADKLAAGYNPVWTREGLFSYSTDNADLTDIAGRTNKRWQSPEEIALLRGVPANYGASAIALSPDGNLLAFGGYRDLFKRTGYTLFVADADGKNAHELFPPF